MASVSVIKDLLEPDFNHSTVRTLLNGFQDFLLETNSIVKDSGYNGLSVTFSWLRAIEVPL